jgi:hypothetical protein
MWQKEWHPGPTACWWAGLLARVLVFAFVVPFILVGSAVVFAVTATQVSVLAAPPLTILFTLVAVRGVLWWMAACPSIRS